MVFFLVYQPRLLSSSLFILPAASFLAGVLLHLVYVDVTSCPIDSGRIHRRHLHICRQTID